MVFLFLLLAKCKIGCGQEGLAIIPLLIYIFIMQVNVDTINSLQIYTLFTHIKQTCEVCKQQPSVSQCALIRITYAQYQFTLANNWCRRGSKTGLSLGMALSVVKSQIDGWPGELLQCLGRLARYSSLAWPDPFSCRALSIKMISAHTKRVWNNSQSVLVLRSTQIIGC